MPRLPGKIKHLDDSASPLGVGAGFTLVEAVVALTVTSIAGTAMLVGINSNIQLTQRAEERIVAQGMARQLMDEVMGTRYMALNTTPYQTVFGPSTWESQLPTRQRYDDIDDFHNWSTQPPVDEYGVPLGRNDGKGGQRHPAFRLPANRFSQWRQEVTVSYVNPNNLDQRLSGMNTSDYRAVRVRILRHEPGRGQVELASISRIVSYVPSVQ